MEAGYLYIATGEKYIQEAKVSIKSLKEVHRNAHTTLITDQAVDIEKFDQVLQIDERNGSFNENGLVYKISSLKKTPYVETFFIDTDTFFCENCQELFSLLEYFDLLVAFSPIDYVTPTVNGKKISGLYPYNTGMIVYKKTENVMSFFDSWEKIFLEKNDVYPHDQPAFMEALLYNDIKILTLQSIYNFRTPFFSTAIAKKVKIIHGRHKNYETVCKKLNRYVHSQRNRVWHPRKKKVINKYPLSLELFYTRFPQPIKKVYQHLKKAFQKVTK